MYTICETQCVVSYIVQPANRFFLINQIEYIYSEINY